MYSSKDDFVGVPTENAWPEGERLWKHSKFVSAKADHHLDPVYMHIQNDPAGMFHNLGEQEQEALLRQIQQSINDDAPESTRTRMILEMANYQREIRRLFSLSQAALVDRITQITGSRLSFSRRPYPSGPYHVMVTGHRPQHIAPGDSVKIKEWLRSSLEAYRQNEHVQALGLVAVSGMALGVDQWFAEAALDLGVPLWAMRPFKGQALQWSKEDQDHHYKLLARAWRVSELHPHPVSGKPEAVKLLMARNQAMVDICDAALVVLRPDREASGGTASTYRMLQAVPGLTIRRYPIWF